LVRKHYEDFRKKRVSSVLRAGAAESVGKKAYGGELAAAGFEAGAASEEHHADVFEDFAKFRDLAGVRVEFAFDFGLEKAKFLGASHDRLHLGDGFGDRADKIYIEIFLAREREASVGEKRRDPGICRSDFLFER
jgi:hypothetical protein